MISLSHIPTLVSERLELRPLQARDFAAYQAYYTGPRTAYVGGALSPAEVATRFTSMIGHWVLHGFGRYAITLRGDSEHALGHVGPLCREVGGPVEMTWTLWDAEAEGNGYAREAAAAVCDALFTAQGMTELLAFVHASNAASARVAQALGFEPAPELPAGFDGARSYRLTAATRAARQAEGVA